MTFTSRLLMLFLLFGGMLQISANDNDPKPCWGYYKGTVTFENGKTQDTYIYVDYCNPHMFQSAVRTIDQKTYMKYAKGKKIKKKAIEKLKIKKVQGFVLEDGREFRQVKYANLLSPKNTDKLPKRQILEVVADGPITIYKRGYRTGNGFIYKPVMDARLAGGQVQYDFMMNNFEVLYQKDKSKNPRNILNANLKNLFGDNPEILKKYQDGEYAFRIEFQRPVTFSANCDTPFLEALLEMVNDYNGGAQDSLTETSFQQ